MARTSAVAFVLTVLPYAVVGGGVLAGVAVAAGTTFWGLALPPLLFFTTLGMGLAGLLTLSMTRTGSPADGEVRGKTIDVDDPNRQFNDTSEPIRIRVGFALAGAATYSLAAFLVL
jgi:hypothetical protein